jgi:hypothetical protein
VSRVGRHLDGRFWMGRPQPPGGCTGMLAAFKLGRGSFAPKVYDSFNPPQGPAKSAQRKAQDMAGK